LDVKSREYEQYLNDLCQYLVEYFHKVNPLVNVSRLLSIIDEDFEQRWTEQKITHWFAPEAPAPTNAQVRERKAKEQAEKAAKREARLKEEAEAKNKSKTAATATAADDDDMNDDAPSVAAVKEAKDTKSDSATTTAPTAETSAAGTGAATASTASTASTATASAGVTVDENSPLFCKACKHMYTKQSVFDGHLSGMSASNAISVYSASCRVTALIQSPPSIDL
jgi:hypothetical protein